MAAAAPAASGESSSSAPSGAGGRGPGSDPKFQALTGQVRKAQRRLSAHPPAHREAAAAQAAARPPADDVEARGKAANAEHMHDAKPGEFSKAAFVKAVEDAVKRQAPKNLDEADSFGESGKADQIKGEIQGQVTTGTQESGAQIAAATEAPPDTAGVEAKPVVPMAADHPPRTPATPDPAQAVPDKLPPSATDLSAGPREVDRQLAGADVTEDQLAESGEPGFTAVLKDKRAAEEHSASAPARMRGHENAVLAAAKGGAKQVAAAAMASMSGARRRTGRAVGSRKGTAKTSDETKRAAVTARLQAVFNATQKAVKEILDGLDPKVDAQFAREEKVARDAFVAEHTQKMDEYKDRRYSGVRGKLRWVRDKFKGLPAEANQIFVAAREGYVNRVRGVISSIADTIASELERAKKRIAAGRAEIRDEVKRLPAELRSLGRRAAADLSARFDELTASVGEKGSALVDVLATKYTDAMRSVDDEIAREKEKNKGLIARLKDAVVGAIKAIIALTKLLIGVLAKAASVAKTIVAHPIRFLGNLVSGVGAGLSQFKKNAGTHLKNGLLRWLTGAAAGAGIKLPATWNAVGLIQMLAGLVGLSWAYIRSRIVRQIPERLVSFVEKSVGIAIMIREKGTPAIAEEIKEKVGDLRENLFSKIIADIVPSVILAGVTWILSLLNPASAFIRAVKMIVDFIRFVVERGREIIEFVDAVLDSVAAIAKGNIGGVAQKVENALARSVPVLIGLLAALLGLGGIASKVRGFFEKLRKPVTKAVDWLVGKIVTLAKKAWTKIKNKFEKKKGAKDPRTPAQMARDLTRAIADAEKLIRPGVTVEKIRKKLPAIKRKRRLSALTVIVDRQESGDTVIHFLARINPEKKSPEDRIKGGGAGLFKARKVGPNSFKGRFADFPEPVWQEYAPLQKVERHPGNKAYRRNDDGIVKRPEGQYTVSGQRTGSARLTQPWRERVDREKNIEKSKLLAANPTWNEKGQRGKAENEAKRVVSERYEDMMWPDLYLLGWEEHHIKPVNWGGLDTKGNMIFIRREHHTPITGFWNSVKARIAKDIR